MRMCLHLAVVVILLAEAALLLSQEASSPGAPLPQIGQAQLDRFRAGQEEFTAVRDPIDGLGPAYNGTSCGACHNLPAVGGSGIVTLTRAGRTDGDGRFSPS